MNIWSHLFPSKPRVDYQHAVAVEIEKLSAVRRDTLQVAQSHSRVMNTLAGAMQLMVQKATDDASK